MHFHDITLKWSGTSLVPSPSAACFGGARLGSTFTDWPVIYERSFIGTPVSPYRNLSHSPVKARMGIVEHKVDVRLDTLQ